MKKIDIKELYNGVARDWAKYVVESRAIPSMIDGMKPSQRFYLYSSLVNSKTSFQKVSAVAGPSSAYGFQHGEASLMGVGQLMGATWNNNVCLVEGRGSFGSRLIQEAGAPRYIYTKIHKNFSKYIRDIDLAPEHSDPEHLPPQYYIPVIPLVLVNGVRGIATGFATNILPRSPLDIKKACVEYIKTGKISKPVGISFPDFDGTTTSVGDGKFVNTGKFEQPTQTKLIITEVPYGFDREGYVKILDELEDDGIIVSYIDECNEDGFKFTVKLKNKTNWTSKQVVRIFKLSKPHTENLNVIDASGELKHYNNAEDIIMDFCDYRRTVLANRIETNSKKAKDEYYLAGLKIIFIKDVLKNRIPFMGKNKKDIFDMLVKRYKDATADNIDKLMSMNFYNLTDEQVVKLEEHVKEAEKDMEYWKETDPTKQALEDLKSL